MLRKANRSIICIKKVMSRGGNEVVTRLNKVFHETVHKIPWTILVHFVEEQVIHPVTGAKGVTSTTRGNRVLPEKNTCCAVGFVCLFGFCGVVVFVCLFALHKKTTSAFTSSEEQKLSKLQKDCSTGTKMPEWKVSAGNERNFLNIRAMLFGNKLSEGMQK